MELTLNSATHVRDFQNVNLSRISEEVRQSRLMKPSIFCTLKGGNEESVERIIRDEELFTDLVDRQGNSVLHIAVSRHHLHIVEIMICSNPNLIKNLNSNGDTIFHAAAGAGHLAVVQLLVAFIIYCLGQVTVPLDERERLNQILLVKNINGDTALHVALRAYHMKVASYLVGANPHASFLANSDDMSPLHLAVEARCVELVKQMLAFSTTDDVESNTFSLASRLEGDSIVHTAIKARSVDILEAIFGKDQSLIKLKDKKGRTCLSYAAFTGFSKGFLYLLEKAVSDVFVDDDDGLFPIHLAAKGGQVSILKEFYKSSPNSKELLNKEGQNILHIAAENGRTAAFVFILRRDRKHKMLNEQDVNGNTPLHLATINREAKMVSAFVCFSNGRHLFSKNNAGQTVMDIAVTNLQSNYVISERFILVALTCAFAPELLAHVPRIGTTLPPDSKTYKERVNTLLVVATLLATVALATAFTIPGSYNSSGSELGMATLAKKAAFKAFVICNTAAMGASMAAVVTLLCAQLSDIKVTPGYVEIALNYLGLALLAMPVGVTAGVFLLVSHIPKLPYIIVGIAALLLYPVPFLLLPFYLQYVIFLVYRWGKQLIRIWTRWGKQLNRIWTLG